MATPTAKQPVTPEQPEASSFAVDPLRVIENSTGFGWRTLMVRMPSGATADVLKDPGLWRKLQAKQRLALRVHDHLYIVAFDESWAADAIVTGADHTKAVLSVGKIHKFETGRFDNLPSDDIYKVVFNGVGFVVVRKSDNHVMTTTSPNIPSAARDMANLYPKAAA